jgi:hypothetical protein
LEEGLLQEPRAYNQVKPPPSGVPEPMTLLLMGPGLAGLLWLRRKKLEKV